MVEKELSTLRIFCIILALSKKLRDFEKEEREKRVEIKFSTRELY